MKKLPAVLIGFLFFLPASIFASDWFLGGGVQLGALGRNPGPPSGCIGNSMQPHILLGVEVDCGLRGNIWMLYSGLRYGNAYHDEGSSSWESTSKWTRCQLLVGSRLHVARSYMNPVKPSLGIAVSYGWTHLSRDESYYYQLDSGFSKGGLGAIAEAGIMVELKGPVTPFWMFQIHTFTADFDRDIYSGRDEDEPMIEALFQAGVLYDISIH